MNNNRISGEIVTEGDIIAYKITGKGIPLLLIAGGGGNGDLYLPLADELKNNYKVITYDRRSNGKSTMNFPDKFDISQQARDAVAILNAIGENSVFVFGNSSGAIIALEMARLFPNKIKGAIVHEPPMAKLHPNSNKWIKFFDDCYNASFKFGGSSMAATKFMFGIEVPVVKMINSQFKAMKYIKNEPDNFNRKSIPSKDASRYLIQQELIKVTNYEPDIEGIKANNNKFIVAIGSYAKQNNTFLYKISKKFSELIEKPYIQVSGHHGSFMDDTKTWADSIRLMISSLNN